MLRRATTFPSWVAAAALALFAALPDAGAQAADAAASAPPASASPTALRVCADPDNLPFTAQEGAVKGLYVELAELVGAKLGLPVAYTWWYTHFQRRAMRNTILANECDAMFALPANADYRARGVQKSRPFLDVGYALVSAPGLTVGSIESLKGKKLALQFGSTPHVLFSTLTGYTSVTYRTPEEIFDALAKGEAEVGVLWGPVAGYENKTRHQGRWLITPVSGHQLAGQVVVGVRADQAALKTRIDQALGELAPQIQDLAAKYGFPTAKPMNLESRTGSAAPALGPHLAAVQVPAALWLAVNDAKPAAASASSPASAPARRPAASKPAAKPATTAALAAPATAAAPPPAPPMDPVVKAGRVRFNDQCSHCHGTDGASPVRERDVRRLVMRNDHDKWQQVALKTIREGRPDAGMPAWKDSLSEQQIKELLAFLATIQK